MAQGLITGPVLLALIEAGKTLLLAIVLLWYVQHRRYPQDRKAATWPAVVGYHIVEIGLIAAMVPSLASVAKLLT